MKKLVFLVTIVALCSCNDKDVPSLPSSSSDESVETYRLDSTYCYGVGDNDTLEIAQKTIYTKNDENEVEFIRYDYADGIWTPSYRGIEIYSFGKVVKASYDWWSKSNNQWQKYMEESYLYNSHGDCSSEEYYSYSSTSTRHSSYKYEYYYTNNRKDSMYRYMYDQSEDQDSIVLKSPANQDFVPWGKYIYKTDARNNIIEEVYFTSSNNPQTKYVRTFDSHNNVLTEEYYRWNPKNNAWYSEQVTTYEREYIGNTDYQRRYIIAEKSTDSDIIYKSEYVNYYTKVE